MAKQSKEVREHETQNTNGFFKNVTLGYNAKVANMVAYVLLQLVMDFSSFQEMLRYVITEWRGDYEGLVEIQNDEPTTIRVFLLLIFVATAFWGGVITVYKMSAGPLLIVANLLAVLTFGYTVILPKVIKNLADNYWKDTHSFSLDDYFVFPGLTTNIATYGTFIGVIMATTWLCWCIYCSIMVMLEHAGFKPFEDNTSTIDSVSYHSVQTSEISTFSEEKYYSDCGSF